MYFRKLYQVIASTIQAKENCSKSGNHEWYSRHEDTLADIERNELPSGSGIDCGTRIILDECTPNKIVLGLQYHHMNDNGFYDGWTEHRVIVTPSLSNDINIKITGRDRNQIKDYLADVYLNVMESTEYSIKQRYDTRRESDKSDTYKITFEWIDNVMVWTCNGIKFRRVTDARIYAIGEMDKL